MGGWNAEARYLQGQGIARQRQAIVNGLRESVLTFERDVKDIGARDVVELMMMTQWALQSFFALPKGPLDLCCFDWSPEFQ